MKLYNVSHFVCCQVDYETELPSTYSDPEYGTTLCHKCFDEAYPTFAELELTPENSRDAFLGSVSTIVSLVGKWEFTFTPQDYDEGFIQCENCYKVISEEETE